MTPILVLGGTAEAVEIAGQMARDPGVQVIYSLAGRTRKPVLPNCHLHTGGFGGIDGLVEFLSDKRVAALIDATHPFARQMPANARAAAASAGVPLFKFLRPAWEEPSDVSPETRWLSAATPAKAAEIIKGRFGRVFLSSGLGDIAAFAPLSGVWFLVRSVEPSDAPAVLAHYHHVISRGPFDIATETALLRDWQIDALVSKNSGGFATAPKLDAARRLGIPVIMIDRPPVPQGPTFGAVTDVTEAVRLFLRASAS